MIEKGLGFGSSPFLYVTIDYRLRITDHELRRKVSYLFSHSAASLTDCWSNFMRNFTYGPSAV